MQSDKENTLIEKARNFDQAGLSEIYDLYNQPLFRYAFRLFGDVKLAEDCVEETFLRFLNAVKNNKGPKTNLQAYLFRTAHNWVMDVYRQKEPKFVEIDEQIPELQVDPAEEIELKHQAGITQQALSSLGKDQKEVIVLKYLEEYDNAEISQIIGKSIGATKALINRATSNLKKRMKQLEQVDGK